MTPGFRKRASFTYLFLAIFIFTLILRFSYLDLRLLHHDEAVHSWFVYDLLTKGNYTYDPMYHGPFLYYATAVMFILFGESDLVARILPALFGSLLIPLVYAIYRLGYLDERQALVAGLFVALSPDLLYFSRFLRHDIFQLTFSLIAVVGLLYYQHRGKFRFAAIAAIGLAGAIACKEDAPLLVVIFAVFAIYLLIFRKITLPLHWKRDLVLSIMIMGGILVALYSSFWTHPEVLLTGIGKAWTHWTAMHAQCRICGPWFFYVLLFLLYEAPIFFLGLFAAAQLIIHGFHCRKTGPGRLARFLRSVPVPAAGEGEERAGSTIEDGNGETRYEGEVANSVQRVEDKTSPNPLPDAGEDPADGRSPLWTGVGQRPDLAGKGQPLSTPHLVDNSIITRVPSGPLSSRGPGENPLPMSSGREWHLRVTRRTGSVPGRTPTAPGEKTPWTRKDDFFLFCLLWFVVTFAAYAYIGEKVPWLIIHQLLPLLLLSTYRMTPRKTAIACISCIFLILVSWHVAFTPGDISEPIVQVQNSEDLRTVMDLIDSSHIVLIASSDYWPLPWYYRGDRWDKMKFYGQRVDESVIRQENPDMVITHDTESYDSLPGYDKRTYKMAYWFSYYDNQDRLIPYYFLRDGKLGSINIDIFLRNRTAIRA